MNNFRFSSPFAPPESEEEVAPRAAAWGGGENPPNGGPVEGARGETTIVAVADWCARS